ncbi:MAG: hypothetical protein U0228_36670 [Myxococcaceae bacterium]
MRILLGVSGALLVGCGAAGAPDGGVGPLWPVGATSLQLTSSVGYPFCSSEDFVLTFGGQLTLTSRTAPPSTPYGPCMSATETRPLNQADLDRLDAAMSALTRPASAQCDVSDGPYLGVVLTLADGGTRNYREAGLGCSTDGRSVTVTGLGTVRSTLEAWAP